jgi:hypothetical protein
MITNVAGKKLTIRNALAATSMHRIVQVSRNRRSRH